MTLHQLGWLLTITIAASTTTSASTTTTLLVLLHSYQFSLERLLTVESRDKPAVLIEEDSYLHGEYAVFLVTIN